MIISDYKIIPIETGRFALDGGAMFGVVPKNLWNKTNPADEQNRIELALRCLLLKSSERIILIDTGIGHKLNEKLSKIYKVDHSAYSLESSLEKSGINRFDVTDVIISHLHFDHTGGTTIQNKGKVELTFPNAKHHIQREQWVWANRPAEKDKASFISDNFKVMDTSGQINFLDGQCIICSGIESQVMYGHTHGMQVIKISDKNQTVLYCSDLIPTASHIPVPWIMAYDNNPLITIEEKKQLLPKIVEENWILFFEHDPFRAAGTVQQTDKGYSLKEEITFNSK